MAKKYGTDRYMEDVVDELELEEDGFEAGDPSTWGIVNIGGKTYSNRELSQMADDLLRADSKREMCRRCNQYGDETGNVESIPQVSDDGPVLDGEGNQLYIDFPELECPKGHRWYRGEGKARGIGGKNPILFENHLQDRKRREIYTSVGTPDPSIQQGIFNRTHPEGRPVNSPEQRRRNGASFYR
jgi:hypothetical protein